MKIFKYLFIYFAFPFNKIIIPCIIKRIFLLYLIVLCFIYLIVSYILFAFLYFFVSLFACSCFIYSLFVYLFQSQINPNKIKSFLYGFLFLFFLSPVIYSYISISQTNKRTDYPGKEVANLVKNFYESQSKVEGNIEFIKGDEWIAGNLCYHLKSKPKCKIS